MTTPIYVETNWYLFSWGALWFFVGLTIGILVAVFTRKKYFDKRSNEISKGAIKERDDEIKILTREWERTMDQRDRALVKIASAKKVLESEEINKNI